MKISHRIALLLAASLPLVPALPSTGADPAPVVAEAAAEGAHLVINVPSRTLTLSIDGRVQKVYRVGVGTRRYPTPVGKWRILEKVVNPTWGYPYNNYKGKMPIIPPGPRNPLGTRWMGFTPQEHGIHGTNRPDTVGKVVSHGCVRMLPREAEELFEIVRVGTPVEVRHDTLRVHVDHARGLVLAAAYPDVYRKRQALRPQLEAHLRAQGGEHALLDEARLRRVFARRDGKFWIVGRLREAAGQEAAVSDPH